MYLGTLLSSNFWKEKKKKKITVKFGYVLDVNNLNLYAKNLYF